MNEPSSRIYINGVDITLGTAKDAANIVKRGLPLADFSGFDAEPITLVDDRFDYGEVP